MGRYATAVFVGGLVAVAVLALLLVVAPAPPPSVRRTLAAVVSASEPEGSGVTGRCTMTLRVVQRDGSEVEVTHVDPASPMAEWPRAGADLVVEVSRGRRPRVRVLWYHGVTYPEPMPEPETTPEPSSWAEPRLEHGRSAAVDRGTEPVPILDSALELVEFDEDEYGSVATADTRPSRRIGRLPVMRGTQRVDLWAAREPSDMVRRYLFPTERFRGEWRRHYSRVLLDFAVGLGLALLVRAGFERLPDEVDVRGVMVNLAQVPSAILLSQSLWWSWVLWRGWAWLASRLVLTNRRIIWIGGVAGRSVFMLPLAKVADSTYRASMLGRLLGYGTFYFGGTPLISPLWRVSHLPSPTDLYLQIVEEIYEPDASEARRRPARVDEGL